MGSYRYEILCETTTDSLIMENNTREKKMNSNVYGIDLGTCNMKIYCKTSNKILNEKNTIALVKKDQIYAYGDAAYAMYEKAPETINVTFPVISGVIADFNNLQTMLQMYLEEHMKGKIRGHHSSFVSLYLLDKYFVQKDSPDFNKIKKLIEVMAGVLQDKLYIERLNESISQAEKTEIGKYAPFFSLPNVKGEKISRTSENLKKKNLLINFWASWGDSIANQNSNAELREIYKKYKKNKYIAMLGISLDLNKEQWKDAIKRDTLDWEQVCDFDGFNSEVAKQYTIRQIPANILLSADGKILAKDLKGEKLKKKIEEVVSAAEEKDKKDNKKRNNQ